MVDNLKNLVTNLFTSTDPWTDKITEDQITKSKLVLCRYVLVINASDKKCERISQFLLSISKLWFNQAAKLNGSDSKIILVISEKLEQSLIWYGDCFIFVSAEIQCPLPVEYNNTIYKWLEHIVRPRNLKLVELR